MQWTRKGEGEERHTLTQSHHGLEIGYILRTVCFEKAVIKKAAVAHLTYGASQTVCGLLFNKVLPEDSWLLKLSFWRKQSRGGAPRELGRRVCSEVYKQISRASAEVKIQEVSSEKDRGSKEQKPKGNIS